VVAIGKFENARRFPINQTHQYNFLAMQE